MAEQLSDSYTSSYIEIFKAIEDLPECTPHAAYELYAGFLEERQLDPSIYLSMAITSGGYARDEKLSLGQAMEKNGEFGQAIARQLLRQYSEIDIEASDVMVPAELGKVEGWGQAEYILFWANVITGLDIKESTIVNEEVLAAGFLDARGFKDSSLSREERWQAYKGLVDGYVALLETNNLGQDQSRPPNNMQAIILILDVGQSLGVNAERYLCHRLGLGEYTAELYQPTIELQQELQELDGLGASSLHIGGLNIWGNVNSSRYWELRERGFKFRKSGILSGIIDRKEAKKLVTPNLRQPTSSVQAVTEYYAKK